MPNQADKVMTHEGRPKKFDFLEGNARRIEGTMEHPVMYHALGTKPRTQHPYHVYEDIRSEPTAVKATLDVIQPAVDKVADEFIKRDITHVVGIGMGTSQFVQQTCGPAFWEWAGITSEDRDSVEFRTYTKPHDAKHTAFLAMSGSGATVDTIEATKKAKEFGMYCVAVTSIAGSPLTKVTHDTIACAGGFDTGGSDTFHYATRLAAILALALKLGEKRGTSGEDLVALGKEFNALPNLMADRLDETDARCRSIAKQVCHVRSTIIVGAGPNFGSAEEMELKFEEMSAIPSKSMVPTRHLHGALGLTDEKILTILLHPKNKAEPWFDQIAKFTMYIKTPSMAILPDKEDHIAPMMDFVIRTPVENEHLFALYVVPAIQMFPYYCAVEQGNLNPDCQRSNIPKYARAWALVLKPGGH